MLTPHCAGLQTESERLIPDAWGFVDDKVSRGVIANHKPVCGGRCLILTHPKVPVWPYGTVNLLPISVLMVTLPMVFWFIFVAPDLWHRVHPALPIVGLLVLLDALFYLALAWMTEPGIMHTTHDDARHNKGQWMVKCPMTEKEFDLVPPSPTHISADIYFKITAAFWGRRARPAP